LPDAVNTKGRFNTRDSPGLRLGIDSDGPVGELTDVLNCVTNPPAVHVPALKTTTWMFAGCPCTGFVGDTTMLSISRSAHGGAAADACPTNNPHEIQMAAHASSSRISE